jgi:hypothetical protein
MLILSPWQLIKGLSSKTCANMSVDGAGQQRRIPIILALLHLAYKFASKLRLPPPPTADTILPIAVDRPPSADSDPERA